MKFINRYSLGADSWRLVKRQVNIPSEFCSPSTSLLWPSSQWRNQMPLIVNLCLYTYIIYYTCHSTVTLPCEKCSSNHIYTRFTLLVRIPLDMEAIDLSSYWSNQLELFAFLEVLEASRCYQWHNWVTRSAVRFTQTGLDSRFPAKVSPPWCALPITSLDTCCAPLRGLFEVSFYSWRPLAKNLNIKTKLMKQTPLFIFLVWPLPSGWLCGAGNGPSHKKDTFSLFYLNA